MWLRKIEKSEVAGTRSTIFLQLAAQRWQQHCDTSCRIYVTRCNVSHNVAKVVDYPTFPGTRNAVLRCVTGCEEGVLHVQFRPQLVSLRRCVASWENNCLVEQRLKFSGNLGHYPVHRKAWWEETSENRFPQHFMYIAFWASNLLSAHNLINSDWVKISHTFNQSLCWIIKDLEGRGLVLALP